MAKALKKISVATRRNDKKPYFNMREIKYIVSDYLPGASKNQVDNITKGVAKHLEIVLYSEIRNAVTQIKNMTERKELIV